MKRNRRAVRRVLASLVSIVLLAGGAGTAAFANDAGWEAEAWPESAGEWLPSDEGLFFEDLAVFSAEELPTWDIQARLEPDNSVSASVSWGEMKFVYLEAEKSWTADGNTVEVTNTSPHAAIQASYSYSPGENGEATMGVFDAEAGAWTIGAESNPTPAASIGGASDYTGGEIAAGGTETLWLLFTTDANVGGLSAEDYTTVGSLSVTVAAA